MNSYVNRRRVRRTFGAIAAVAAIAGTTIAVNASPAGAAFTGDPYETAFEIDGNTVVDGGQDWDSDPAVATNLNDAPFETAEVCNVQPIEDPENPGEFLTEDTTIITPGTAIDDPGFLIDNPPVQEGSILTKGDICSVWQTWEIVETGGEYEFIFYGAWTRPNVNGEINILYPLLGEDTTTNDDDLLISYDFEDNSDTTTVTVLHWDGNSWEPTPPPGDAFEAITTRGEDQTQASLEEFTFGEFAINLTAAGILPQDGPCTTFTAGDPMSRTGNSQSATLKDIVGTPPLTLTNCSSITVTKETAPAVPSGSPAFDAVITQLDGQDVLFGDPSVGVNLVVPDAPSVTVTDVLISPDYFVEENELTLPEGWTQVSVVCTSWDPIAGAEVVATLYGGDDLSFPVAPGHEAECIIKNIGPPTVSVDKVTIGGAGGPFDFDVEWGETTDELSATTTEAGEATTAGSVIVEPGSVTVGETSMPAGFYADDLVCVVTDAEGVAGAPVVGADDNGAPTGVTADVAAGESMHCTQTNLAAGSVDVTKTVAGTSTDWAFDFTISPVPAGEVATKTATAAAPTVSWGNLQPGVEYTVTEDDEPGYISGVVNCGEGNSFVATPGGTATCGVTNTELADVSVTKTVVGPATWSFDFTISPVPAGETATKTATDAAPTVSWTGLTPGTAYTITESAVDGFIQGTLECGEDDSVGESTFTPGAGESVDCAITNVGTGSATVTKTVPGETGWSYNFTISPVPTGETATKTATSAAPTVRWDNLIPGVDYTISEVVSSDLVVGTMTCAGGDNAIGTSTFQVTAGGTTSCSITNSRITDISVTKTAGGPEALAGGPVDWTIVVKNNGPSTAVNVKLVDTLPNTLVLTGVTGPAAWSCSTTTGVGGSFTCTTPQLVPGESATFTVRSVVVAGLAAVTIQNVATVTTSSTETTTDNNSDQDVVVVPPLAVLPPTGGVFGMQMALAAFLLLGGVTAVGATQRRRRIA